MSAHYLTLLLQKVEILDPLPEPGQLRHSLDEEKHYRHCMMAEAREGTRAALGTLVKAGCRRLASSRLSCGQTP